MNEIGSNRSTARFVGRLIGVITAIASSVAAPTQVPTTGLTPAEARSINILNVAPYFQLWRSWQRCTATVAGFALESFKDAASTSRLAFSGCSDKEGDLRSTLARSVGPQRAAAITALAKRVETSTYNAAHSQKYALKPGEIGRVRGWSIKVERAGYCSATKTDDDMFGTKYIVVDNLTDGNGTFHQLIFFMVTGGSARANPFPPEQKEVVRFVVAWNRLSATQIGPHSFKIGLMGGGFSFGSKLDDTWIRWLQTADTVQLMGGDKGDNFKFDVAGISEALDAVRRCHQTHRAR